jgi:hypothetical protein
MDAEEAARFLKLEAVRALRLAAAGEWVRDGPIRLGGGSGTANQPSLKCPLRYESREATSQRFFHFKRATDDGSFPPKSRHPPAPIARPLRAKSSYARPLNQASVMRRGRTCIDRRRIRVTTGQSASRLIVTLRRNTHESLSPIS